MLHVWPLMASPEGAEAREVIMEFLRTHRPMPPWLQEQNVQDQATGTDHHQTESDEAGPQTI